jgi:hypothetical protein
MSAKGGRENCTEESRRFVTKQLRGGKRLTPIRIKPRPDDE